MSDDAFAAVLPEVSRQVPRVVLGVWPTPIEGLEVPGLVGEHFVKREDLSSPVYGGNKVRCLEPVFAAAVDRGARRVWATGAYGSNQALAIATHAPAAGLETGAILFPQPSTTTARANLRALASTPCQLRLTRSILTFPLAVARQLWGAERGGRREQIIPPGAAVPLGAIGHVAAALEVALEVARGALPAPAHVVLPVGSTCTSAGLLVGFAVAAQLGVGFEGTAPTVHSVRISPWPVTARFRIVGLARRTALHLRSLGGPDVVEAVSRAASLETAGGLMGGGYGKPSPAGIAAKSRFAEASAPPLDTTYSAKAAAHLLEALSPRGPVLFWSTKSSAPLPEPTAADLARLPAPGQRWLSQRDRLDPPTGPEIGRQN
ncbi:MAG: pyridoxal-phosphate dependent enzyme [Myxococcota bacterium]|nr:pyridoxal-phosphate dependent enzyme [Myxococcota bacterium]